jgi:hypothetical protein
MNELVKVLEAVTNFSNPSGLHRSVEKIGRFRLHSVRNASFGRKIFLPSDNPYGIHYLKLSSRTN